MEAGNKAERAVFLPPTRQAAPPANFVTRSDTGVAHMPQPVTNSLAVS